MIDRRPFENFRPDFPGVRADRDPGGSATQDAGWSPELSFPPDQFAGDELLRSGADVVSVALLLTLAGIASYVVGGIVLFLTMSDPWMPTDIEPAAILLGCGLLLLCVGSGLRKRSPVARVLAAIIAAAGLVQFPFGTAAGLLSLYLLFNTRAQWLFGLSANFKDVAPVRFARVWRRILGMTSLLLLCTLLQVIVAWPSLSFLNR